MNEISNTFFEDVLNLLNNARKNVNKAVNLAMVYSYFEIGRKIFVKRVVGVSDKELWKRIFRYKLETNAAVLLRLFAGSNWSDTV